MTTYDEKSYMDNTMGWSMQDKLRYIAGKIQGARKLIDLNSRGSYTDLEAAKEWADNEVIKLKGPFSIIAMNNPKLNTLDYVWKEYVLWLLNHIDDEPFGEDGIWYMTVDDFLEGQLISD